MSQEETVYWRFKGDKTWQEAWMQPVPNTTGLVRLKGLQYWADWTIYSEDEIEIKRAAARPGKGEM